jgi:uroporphyrinogen decarboxylase
VWSTNDIDRGAPLVYSLPEANLSHFTFPDPNDPWRFEGLAEWCTANNDRYYTALWVGALWERATFMRSMEELLYDLVENRSFVEELLEHLTDNILQTMERLFAVGEFDCCCLSDDYGTQKSLLMSPADWRALIKPRFQRMIDLAKRHGKQFFLHSCGCVQDIIPDFIELGLDILHPIQPETMDIEWLKREFGKDITFCGGVPTQNLLPYGTPDEVRAEVRRLKTVMGASGGYILEPGITLQDDVPVENLVALVEEAKAK